MIGVALGMEEGTADGSELGDKDKIKDGDDDGSELGEGV